jgi:DNA-binding response OmpR family regulator
MLPGLNGYRVCSMLRVGGYQAGVLMLTAKDGEWDEAEALDTGADNCLSKPFSYVVLVARLRALARRVGGRQPRLVSLGDLAVDLTRTCARAGEPIRLTAREFAVLEHLALRAGDVVSKRDILNAVWDEHYDGGANVVEVHVSALRRKIDTPYRRAAVQTVRGVGYRLAVDGG